MDELGRAWARGDAVLPLDPGAPASELDRLLKAMRPALVVEPAGERPLPDPLPVASGVAAVVTTSGTGGALKGIELTHHNLRSAAEASEAVLGREAGDRWLCCLPVHHVAGLLILVRASLAGSSPIIHPRFDPEAIAAEQEATLVSVVPTMLLRLLDAGVDLSRFRRILVGGAAVAPALLRRAARAGARVVTTYGSTETTGGVVYDGVPLPGTQVKVSEAGEIALRGTTIMRGYRWRPDLTAAAFRDGWFHTADVGQLDGQGRLTVLGRSDDLIVTGGRKVAPAEVEAALRESPHVADVAVFGLDDAEWGQRVVAVVVASGIPGPTLEGLSRLVGGRLAGYKLPRELRLVERIPRGPSGKVSRNDLTELLRGPPGVGR